MVVAAAWRPRWRAAREEGWFGAPVPYGPRLCCIGKGLAPCAVRARRAKAVSWRFGRQPGWRSDRCSGDSGGRARACPAPCCGGCCHRGISACPRNRPVFPLPRSSGSGGHRSSLPRGRASSVFPGLVVVEDGYGTGEVGIVPGEPPLLCFSYPDSRAAVAPSSESPKIRVSSFRETSALLNGSVCGWVPERQRCSPTSRVWIPCRLYGVFYREVCRAGQ